MGLHTTAASLHGCLRCMKTFILMHTLISCVLHDSGSHNTHLSESCNHLQLRCCTHKAAALISDSFVCL